MNTRTPGHLEAQWARIGVLFNCRPAPHTPDLERLLLSTGPAISRNARLFPLVVTWLVEYGQYVAKHRLKRLAVDELLPEHRPVLGLLLQSAIAHGASADLRIALDACHPAATPRPLFEVHQKSRALTQLAERNASSLSKYWKVWAPDVELKRDAIRPAAWLVDRNPTYRDRAARKGDLRCSILETLRHDADGTVRSESELARLSGATRPAVQKAVLDLIREGELSVRRKHGNKRDNVVTLRRTA